MYKMIYIGFFIASIFCLIALIKTFSKQASFNYVILFCSVAIENFGFTQIVHSTTLQAALNANQIAYLGGCCIPLFSIMCLRELLHSKNNKWFQLSGFIFLCFIFVCVCSVGKSTIYYKNVELTVTPDYAYLTKEYGPLHSLYAIYFFVTVVYGIISIVIAYTQKRKVSYISCTILLCTMSISAIVYFLERFFHSKIELLPFAFVVMEIGLLILLRRTKFYDVYGISSSSIAQSENYGFFIIDSTGRFYGADEKSKEWFPELGNLKIDYKIGNRKTKLLKKINLWTKDKENIKPVIIESGDKSIEVKPTVVKEKKKSTVYCIMLRDDTEQQKAQKVVKSFNVTLQENVNKKTNQLSKVQNDIILSMASIVENRDNNTGGHIARTSDIIKIFIKHLSDSPSFSNINNTFAGCIKKAASLHDFGKIAIPDNILNKPGKFTSEEYEIMKQHAEKGAKIVSKILQNSDDNEFRTLATNVAHYHHEKWDGSGYPEHLEGTNIPFEARIMALADVFDALVSKRVYKEKFSYDKAFEEIENGSGTHFDPELCSEFLACRSKLITLYNNYKD